MQNYDKLKSMLEAQETFPLRFTYKIIGKNTPDFLKSVAAFEQTYEEIEHVATRITPAGGHISKTYVFVAPDASAIIAIYQEIEKIIDLAVIL